MKSQTIDIKNEEIVKGQLFLVLHNIQSFYHHLQRNAFTYSENGFTLIELIIVFTIFAILSGVGIASFVTYSRSQAVSSSMNELKTTIDTARSRALSQLKTSNCGNNLELLGYQVVFCSTPGQSHPGIACNNASNAYELQMVCSNSDGSGQTSTTVLEKKFLDPSIVFDASTNTSYIFFSTLSATVMSDSSTNISQVAIKGYNLTKSVTVSQAGVIQ